MKIGEAVSVALALRVVVGSGQACAVVIESNVLQLRFEHVAPIGHARVHQVRAVDCASAIVVVSLVTVRKAGFPISLNQSVVGSSKTLIKGRVRYVV